MSLRKGVSLLEVVVAVAILAILVGLVLTAVQQVRAASLLAQSSNNLRQIVLSFHQLADQSEGRVKGLTQTVLPRKPLYAEASIFRELLPWTYGPVILPDNPTKEQLKDYFHPTVKCYRSPADPTLAPLPGMSGEETQGKCSYVCNMLVFDGAVTLSSSVPDGASGTIAFAEHYHVCGWGPYGGPAGQARAIVYDYIFPDNAWPHKPAFARRRATFADKGWGDVLPVTDGGRTRASIPGLTFQHRPTVADADPRVPQTPHPAGLPAALFDGSVRTLSPRIDESVFWSLVTPNGGEVVGDF